MIGTGCEAPYKVIGELDIIERSIVGLDLRRLDSRGKIRDRTDLRMEDLRSGIGGRFWGWRDGGCDGADCYGSNLVP